jgi:hypothetical protein
MALWYRAAMPGGSGRAEGHLDRRGGSRILDRRTSCFRLRGWHPVTGGGTELEGELDSGGEPKVGKRDPDDSVATASVSKIPARMCLAVQDWKKRKLAQVELERTPGVAELTSSFVFGGPRRIEVHEPVSRVRTTER